MRTIPSATNSLFASLWGDLRLAMRLASRERRFCALAIGVLALGIAAVTTQFAIVNAVVLRGLAFPDADRLVDVRLSSASAPRGITLNPSMTQADYEDLKAAQTSFEGFAEYLNITAVNVSWNGLPQRRPAAFVSHDFFRVLGVMPALGRDFVPEDDRAGAAPAILLSDALWREEFAADPGVIGRPLRVNGRTGTIVGVMPPRFSFPHDEQLWLPVHPEFPLQPRHERPYGTAAIVARLKRGVSLAQATAEVETLARRLALEHPENRMLTSGEVRPLIDTFSPPELRRTLSAILAFCGGVLLIAWVNVANMQFARVVMRGREFAIRASFGATRARLVSQVLVETLVLASVGSMLGLGLAVWAIDWIDRAAHQFSFPLPSWMAFTLDGRVLLFTAAVTGLTVLGAGLMPGLLAARSALAIGLQNSSRTHSGVQTTRLSRLLVTAQIVLTTFLLTGALLQLRSILRQQHLDHGYDTSGVFTARMSLMPGTYPSDEARQVFFERLLRGLRTDPSLVAAGFSDRYRMVYVSDTPIEVEGQSGAGPQVENQLASYERVSDGYLGTLGVRLVDGRDFTPEDNDARQPVAIVNATFARRYFGEGSPIGRRFRPVNANRAIVEPWRVVVGVSRDVRVAGPFGSRSGNAAYYVPFSSALPGKGRAVASNPQFATIVVRPREGTRPDAALAAVRRVIGRIDPDLPVYYVGTPQQQFEGFLAPARLTTTISIVVGVIAILLAAVGLYGVTSYAVSRRLREFGIRLALGADQRQLILLLSRQVARQIAGGLTVGFALVLAVALFIRGAVQEVLFEVSPTDPVTYGAVAILLIGASFLAIVVPARRAARVDPVVALRAD